MPEPTALGFYYSRLIPYIKKKVKHDDPILETINRVGFSAFTDEPLNLFLKGPSSVGKSYIVVQALNCIPKKFQWNLGGMSPKALLHDPKAVLIDEDGNPLGPPDVLPKKDREAWEEYRNKRKKAKYLFDLKNLIIVFLEAPHIETFNILRPILSHDEREIEYKIAPRTSSERFTQTVVLRHWPAMICATTDRKYLEDLATRSLTVTPSESTEKFIEANMVTAEKFSLPRIDKEDLELAEIRKFVEHVIANEVMVLSPQANLMAQFYPHEMRRDMRDFQKFLSLVMGNAKIHSEHRPKMRINKLHTFTLTTLEDYLVVERFWKQIITTTKLGISAGSIELYRKILKPLEAENTNINTLTIQSKYRETFKKPIYPSSISERLAELKSANLVEEATDEADRRRKKYLLIDGVESENEEKSLTENLIGLFDNEKLNLWLNKLKVYFEKKGLLHSGNFNVEFFYQDDVIETEILLKYLNSFEMVRLSK